MVNEHRRRIAKLVDELAGVETAEAFRDKLSNAILVVGETCTTLVLHATKRLRGAGHPASAINGVRRRATDCLLGSRFKSLEARRADASSLTTRGPLRGEVNAAVRTLRGIQDDVRRLGSMTLGNRELGNRELGNRG